MSALRVRDGGIPLGLVAFVLGPVVSFGVLWTAHRRTKDAPAAEEEARRGPFVAWLPVALFDAATLAINLLAIAIADPF